MTVGIGLFAFQQNQAGLTDRETQLASSKTEGREDKPSDTIPLIDIPKFPEDKAARPGTIPGSPATPASPAKATEDELAYPKVYDVRDLSVRVTWGNDSPDSPLITGATEKPGPTRKEKWNREAYDRIVDNPFLAALGNPLSTFSIDVDTASYSNTRRMLNGGALPPRGAVRIEELVNYFPYDYAPPKTDSKRPFAVHTAVAVCPWQPKHKLVRIALKGKKIPAAKRPPSNLVFLLDVSGSMCDDNKLPLVRKSMKMLVDRLGENDRIAIVTYAAKTKLVLDSTSCHKKAAIIKAIGQLISEGRTDGGEGIQLAYKVAAKNFIKNGTNRVILCSDGDFNVGTTSSSELTRLIENKAKTGVFLTVLGFGMGNYQDNRLEQLADKGNGNYGYIDTAAEAKKLLVDGLTGTLITIAKDVKIQVEFNPARVAAYRLIGYENRMLKKEDFNDDKKDAGEIGAGHTVTALYEVVPVGQKTPAVAPAKVDTLKYLTPAKLTKAADGDEMLTVKLRYKLPAGEKSTLMQVALKDADGKIGRQDKDFQFAAAVAGFGMILRDSPYKGTYTLAAVEELAAAAKGKDPNGYRAEFIALVKKARKLKKI
ncbi:MAG: VWA domain-containing protein [Phycisphaerae bacterium]|nr:VWA domain-containing protein [Phycisphaerae bacterium]